MVRRLLTGWSGLGGKRAWLHWSAVSYLDAAVKESRKRHSTEHVAVVAAVVSMLAVLGVEKLHELCDRVPLVARVVAFAPAYSVA